MNSKNVRLGATILMLATSSFFGYVANAEDVAPPALADAAPSPEDAGTPDGEGDADAGPAYPVFSEKPFLDEKTPRPSKSDWKDAPQFQLDEGSLPGGGVCTYQRIREWMRIRCEISTGKITLMSGNGDDVFVTLDPFLPENVGLAPEGGDLIFAVRKGDRRLFEWLHMTFGYGGMNNANSFLVISEMWLPGEEKPTIIAR
jgi:hypothetical protein